MLRPLQAMFRGLPDGSIRIECDRPTCVDWQQELAPYSTLADIEYALRQHVHQRKKAAE